MATGSILLPIGAVVSRTGQPSNLGPAMQRVKSSATAPAPYFLQLALDAANLESAMWAFRMPADYAADNALVTLLGGVITRGSILSASSDAAASCGAGSTTALFRGTANRSSSGLAPHVEHRSPTANHMDHVHVSAYGSSGTAL